MREPAAANSVQLAKLDLYTLSDPPSEPPPALMVSAHRLLAAARLALQTSLESSVCMSINTLLLILSKVAQHPADSKYRCLQLQNSKIQTMLSSNKEDLQLLQAIGPHFV